MPFLILRICAPQDKKKGGNSNSGPAEAGKCGTPERLHIVHYQQGPSQGRNRGNGKPRGARVCL